MISFVSVFPPYRGGIATFSEKLCLSLAEKTEVAPYNFRKLYPKLLFPGSSQLREEYTGPLDPPSPFHPYDLFSQRKTAEQVASGRPAFLLYSYWHPFFAPSHLRLLQQLGNRYPGIRRVGLVHNVIPHEYFPFKRHLARRLFTASDRVILLSGQTEQQYLKLDAPTPYEKLFHPVYELPEPAEPNDRIREKHGFSPDDKIVLYLGLVRKYKGVDLLIEALNGIDLQQHGLSPVIAGEFYTDSEAMLGRIRPADRNRYTVYDRFLQEQEMSELLSIADLMVLPYRRASQSGVLANAIWFNLPVLVSDLPGLTEHITPHKEGLTFRPGDPDHLRSRLLAYFEEGLQEPMSRNMEKLKQALSWDRFTSELLSRLES